MNAAYRFQFDGEVDTSRFRLKHIATATRPQKYARMGYHDGSESMDVAIYGVIGRYTDELLKLLPDGVTKDLENPRISFLEVVVPEDAVSPVVACHVDYGRHAAINVNLMSHGEEVVFPTVGDSAKMHTNDAWLFKTDEPHFVRLEPGKVYQYLSFSFNYARYDQIRSALELAKK